MTEFGLAKVKAAKKNGQWFKSDRPDVRFEIPKEFQWALEQNATARECFNRLAPSYQKQYIGWIAFAKQPSTRAKRIKEAIVLLEQGQKLGLK